MTNIVELYYNYIIMLDKAPHTYDLSRGILYHYLTTSGAILLFPPRRMYIFC